ncbi:MAG TPA: PHP domain-containing protein, partial [Candidatus Limnocylindrales bacterium]
HLAITDHDRIDGALLARDLAPEGLTVIIGEEVKTTDGDLICVFLEHALAPGRPAVETIAAAREQGALVGIPHPFDRYRNSLLRTEGLAALAGLVDWVETWNARIVGRAGNEQAVEFALAHGLPGVAASDAHSTLEVGVAFNTAVDADPSTPSGLLAALATLQLTPGRASYYVRLLTPLAKAVNRGRGNVRIRPPVEP